MSRRGVYRGVYCVLQNDPDFRRLTPRARHTLLSMRLAEYVGIACVWRYDFAIISAQTGYSIDELEPIFAELERGLWIARDGEFVWLRNGLKYDPSINLHNEKHIQGILRTISGLPKMPLLRKFCRYYHLPYPFGRLSKTNGLPSEYLSSPKLSSPRQKQEQEQKQKQESQPLALATKEPSTPDPPTAEQLAEHQARLERARSLLRGAGLNPPS